MAYRIAFDWQAAEERADESGDSGLTQAEVRKLARRLQARDERRAKRRAKWNAMYGPQQIERLSRSKMVELSRRTGAHPLQYRDGGDLYTPVTLEMIELLNAIRANHRTWRIVAEIVGCRTRVLRKIRNGETRCVSMRFWDRLLTAFGLGHLMDNHLWFEPDDMVALGFWKPPVVFNGTRTMAVYVGSKVKRERRRGQWE